MRSETQQDCKQLQPFVWFHFNILFSFQSVDLGLSSSCLCVPQKNEEWIIKDLRSLQVPVGNVSFLLRIMDLYANVTGVLK